MDVNTANILPLIWASKFNLGLSNLASNESNNNSTLAGDNGNNGCIGNLNRQINSGNQAQAANNPSQMLNGNLWPAAAAAALSTDFTTSFKQLLANAAAAAVNCNGISSSLSPNSEGDGAGHTGNNGGNVGFPALMANVANAAVPSNGFNGNSNGSNNSNSGRVSPTGQNGCFNIQQALMARLGQAAAILSDKQQQQPQSNQYPANYSTLAAVNHQNSQLQLQNNKLLHQMMPSFGNISSPGKWLSISIKVINLVPPLSAREQSRGEIRLLLLPQNMLSAIIDPSETLLIYRSKGKRGQRAKQLPVINRVPCFFAGIDI